MPFRPLIVASADGTLRTESDTPGQGQDIYPAESNVTAILEVTGELSHRASIVSIISIVPIHLLD